MGNDPLFVNKIAAAVLSAGLLAMLTGFAAHMLYHPKELEKQAYMISGDAPVTGATAAAVPTGPEPIMAMLASASADAGKKITKKCAACHSFTKGGPNKIGPNLWNIVGGKPASATGYKYSSAMKGMAANWEFKELNKFLFKPKAYLKGTKMSFAGLKKASDRAAIIAYLTSLSDSPKPFQ
jgi:cytochrome c